ncbi:MAG: IPT/TIG domain-containing protein [Candidatus Saganbacteria bacterium]|nr:IPT/TIG domain-containing protein [Candidatus Saganbacteria bacterium]
MKTMINKITKVLGGLLIAALMLNSLPLMGTAHAAAVTINVTGITNHSAATLGAGAYVQVVQSGDATAGAPDTNGLPTGDTVISTGTINPAGQFSGAASVPSSQYIYIRVWETWDGTGTPPAGTYYGTGAVENVGTGFVYVYDPAGFATSSQTSVPSTGNIQFSASTYSVGEGAGSVTVTVRRVSGSSGAASVHYATSNGTATAGSDYTSASGTLNWSDGDSANKTFNVTIADDATYEGNETVTLTLSGVTGASMGSPSTATLTINDDETPPASLTISTTSLPDGTQGTAYSQTVSAAGGTTPYTWSISAGSLPAGLSLNASTGQITGTPTAVENASFTVQVEDAVAATDTQALSINVTSGGGGGPSISDITGTASHGNYPGQTIFINGSGFGDTIGSSTVTVGGVASNPTQWSDTQIITSIPSGVASGDASVVVTTSGGSNSNSLAVRTDGAFIDDVEGGSVGTWTTGLADSGYYAYGTGITPDNSAIVTDGPQAAAAHDGSRGMQIRYSYAGDWGGGWGATLANTMDLSSYDRVSFYIAWDGSGNDIKLGLKDADGTVYSATVSNTTLSSLTSYAQITIFTSAFSHDADGSETGANSTLDWSQITSYNFVYTATNTSTSYHHIDTLVAGDVTGGGGGDVTTEIIITQIEPSAGPAGTKFTAIGEGFGDTQGQSILVFENNSSGTNYQVDILSWSDTSIEAIVPRLAPTGDYTLKVLKLAISAGTLTAQESNPETFQVTAASSSTGKATVYPNPFNPLETSVPASRASGMSAATATIAYDATGVASVGIYIYDSTARLVYHAMTTDQTQISWDGTDMHGNHVADGVYLLRVVNEEAKTTIAKAKILVVKR